MRGCRGSPPATWGGWDGRRGRASRVRGRGVGGAGRGWGGGGGGGGGGIWPPSPRCRRSGPGSRCAARRQGLERRWRPERRSAVTFRVHRPRKGERVLVTIAAQSRQGRRIGDARESAEGSVDLRGGRAG